MSNRPRLSAGEYEPELTGESKHWISRYTACWQFLDSVRARYPEVLDDLNRFPYAPEDIVAGAAPAGTLLEGNDLGSVEQALDWLRGWARRHSLEGDLILKAAARTICEWRLDPVARAAHKWAFPDTIWRLPDSTLAPILPDPFTEDHAKWSKRAERLWEERVRELKAAHCTSTRRLNVQHFDWLARLVVGGETRAAIARSEKVAPQAVAKATRSLAIRIELTLPKPARGGRPRSTKTNNS